MKLKMDKKKLIIIFCITVICVLIIPYIKVEILTWQHGEEFTTLYQQTNMIDEIEYFKVMDYSDTRAKVYYISKGHVAADLLNFRKLNGQWVLGKWETIWSKTGSADGFMWPYYK